MAQHGHQDVQVMLPKKKRIKSAKTMQRIRDIGYCEYCGRQDIALHAHHVVSRGAGGDDLESNLVCLCAICHTKAHAGNIGRDKLRMIVSVGNNDIQRSGV